jgi:hypothetical protein
MAQQGFRSKKAWRVPLRGNGLSPTSNEWEIMTGRKDNE